MIINKNPFMLILMSVFLSYVFDQNHEMIHRHKMLNFLNNWQFELFLQFCFYVLTISSDSPIKKQWKWMKKKMNMINKFKYIQNNFVIFKSTLSINAEICLFLKHEIQWWFFFIDITIAYDFFHEMFDHFFVVKNDFRIFFLIFEQIMIHQNLSGFVWHKKNHENSLISKIQHANVIHFHVQFKKFWNFIAIQIDFYQWFQIMRFDIIEKLYCSFFF